MPSRDSSKERRCGKLRLVCMEKGFGLLARIPSRFPRIRLVGNPVNKWANVTFRGGADPLGTPWLRCRDKLRGLLHMPTHAPACYGEGGEGDGRTRSPWSARRRG